MYVKSKLRPACLTVRKWCVDSVNVSGISMVNVKNTIGLNLYMPDLCSPKHNPSLLVLSICIFVSVGFL